MKRGAPWSVKGIEPEARAAAKSAARRAGMTLGEWLNHVILDSDGSPGSGDLTIESDAMAADPARMPWREDIELLSTRILDNEKRTTRTLVNIDRALIGLSDKLTGLGELERMSSDPELDHRLQQLETRIGGFASKKGMIGIEKAVGDIAGIMMRSDEKHHERIDILAKTLDGLCEQLEQTQAHVQEVRAKAGSQTQSGGISEETALRQMRLLESVITDVSVLGDRMVTSEEETNRAIEALHKKIGEQLVSSDGEDKEAVAAIYAKLSDQLTAAKEETRQALAALHARIDAKLTDASDHEAKEEMASLQARIEERLAKNEKENEQALAALNARLDSRLAASEDDARQALSAINTKISDRIAASEEAAGQAIHSLEERIVEQITTSREDVAQAIEDVRVEINAKVATAAAEEETREAIDALHNKIDERFASSEEEARAAIDAIYAKIGDKLAATVSEEDTKLAIDALQARIDAQLAASRDDTSQSIEALRNEVSEKLIEAARSEETDGSIQELRDEFDGRLTAAEKAARDAIEAIHNKIGERLSADAEAENETNKAIERLETDLQAKLDASNAETHKTIGTLRGEFEDRVSTEARHEAVKAAEGLEAELLARLDAAEQETKNSLGSLRAEFGDLISTEAEKEAGKAVERLEADLLAKLDTSGDDNRESIDALRVEVDDITARLKESEETIDELAKSPIEKTHAAIADIALSLAENEAKAEAELQGLENTLTTLLARVETIQDGDRRDLMDIGRQLETIQTRLDDLEAREIVAAPSAEEPQDQAAEEVAAKTAALLSEEAAQLTEELEPELPQAEQPKEEETTSEALPEISYDAMLVVDEETLESPVEEEAPQLEAETAETEEQVSEQTDTESLETSEETVVSDEVEEALETHPEMETEGTSETEEILSLDDPLPAIEDDYALRTLREQEIGESEEDKTSFKVLTERMRAPKDLKDSLISQTESPSRDFRSTLRDLHERAETSENRRAYIAASVAGVLVAGFITTMVVVSTSDTPEFASGERPSIWEQIGNKTGLARSKTEEPEVTNVGSTTAEVENASFDPMEGLIKAAEGNEAKAQFALARAFSLGEGVTADEHEAVKWYTAASDNGLAIAQFYLALRYQRGDVIEQDMAEAVRLFELSATSGNVNAMYNLGVILTQGEVGERDLTLAARWFLTAAERGLRDAQYNLALFLDKGIGVPKDQVEAAKWYKIASLSGDEKSTTRLEELMNEFDAPTAEFVTMIGESWKPEPINPIANGYFDTTPIAYSNVAMREQISAIQSRLAYLGYNVASTDGIFDFSTRDAIQDFERKANLPISGAASQSILRTLEAAGS